MQRTFFITGTGTGVGKTVFTALFARFLREKNINVAALKPICSGGREDARALHAALGGALTLDEINPWHFRAAIAPSLAAAREKKSVKLDQMLAHICATRKKFDVVLVEGAGGLLSPLGEKFNSRDLIKSLDAMPIIIAPNKLGTVNHLLLTLEALPKDLRIRAKIILMSPRAPDTATASNVELLTQFVAAEQIFTLPWLGETFDAAKILKITKVRQTFLKLLN
jgi:dethiobiotin synthetase